MRGRARALLSEQVCLCVWVGGGWVTLSLTLSVSVCVCVGGWVGVFLCTFFGRMSCFHAFFHILGIQTLL